ncbi:hypothetical protein Patl1_15576 [Pistacia atlantica]|uniref:Uncharacterized protein n=1 Tax=Pistacia atlantica TaxID=434234 RepID=A0ACC1B5V1_9ROSI|nr:hypothetical protein Patl1_15576 [Pistacia atlantica]
MGTLTDVGVQQQKCLRGYAIVHFTATEAADTIKSLADERLWYGNSCLKAQVMGKGPKLGHIQHRIKDLQYESIRLVELHCLQDKRFIIIQLFGVPRIYSKDVPDQTFFRDDTDVQWVHEVDFTPSSCIGQSIALCLELPTTGYLSAFQKEFAYYKETTGKLVVEREVVQSSNVLRIYSDDGENFIRVSFVNEDLGKIHLTDLSPQASLANIERHTRVYQRILSTLRNGIVIADKKFEFLAFSHSQLKDNSVWMFASGPRLIASEIRERLGDFSGIRIVAKYSAKLGQSFSSSKEGVNVDKNEIEEIPDIEVEKGGVKYNFSDGIGKISATLAHMVAGKCGFRTVPSAFQI